MLTETAPSKFKGSGHPVSISKNRTGQNGEVGGGIAL